jgi:hypothetical protein
MIDGGAVQRREQLKPLLKRNDMNHDIFYSAGFHGYHELELSKAAHDKLADRCWTNWALQPNSLPKDGA